MRAGDRYIDVTIDFEQEDGMWAAACRELGTATCGDDFEEAKAHIVEAIELHLNTLEELGERARFCRERGICVVHAI